MKKIYIAFLAFFFCISSYAQFTDELGDICYDIGFRCITTDIDPIEGLYTVSTESKIMQNNEVVKQLHTDGSLTIYSNSDGTIRDYNNKFEFHRIGRTQSYDVNILWPEYDITKHERIRINYTDFFDVSFSLTYEMPQLELKARFGEYYVPGLKAVYSIQCKKIIPNRKMIEEVLAVLEKQKESETKIWTGTGFSITNNLIVTNFHVVDEAKSIYITNEIIKDTISASIIASDQENDLAILSVESGLLPNPKYSLLKEPQKTGTDIWVLGYPLTSTMGNEIKATSGIISSQSGYKGDEVLYQISAPIQPGNSGGPVFDLNGNVVGIVCAHHTYAENVSYAIKTSYLLDLLSSRDSYIDKQPTSINAGHKTLPELIEQSKPFVFHIICINK
jgi:S1-C subfamily serine protease